MSEQTQPKIDVVNPVPQSNNDQMKMMMVETFNSLYMNLINFVNRLQLNQVLRSHGYMNLDQGADWIRKAIVNIEDQSSSPVVDASSQADSTKDEDTKIETQSKVA